MRLRYYAAAVSVMAMATLSMTGQPASAAALFTGCKTSDGGAAGGMNYAFKSKKNMDLALILKDTARDGAFVRIRLDITTGKGDRHTFPWHNNRDGYNKSKTWPTSASHPDGIVSARVQVEDVKGSSPQATCYSGKVYNPYY